MFLYFCEALGVRVDKWIITYNKPSLPLLKSRENLSEQSQHSATLTSVSLGTAQRCFPRAASQNHRTVRGTLKGILSQASHLESRNSNVSKNGVSTHLGTLFQCSVTLTVKTASLCSEAISVCACHLLFCHWTLLKRAWICLLHTLHWDLYTLTSPQSSLLYTKPRWCSQPFLRREILQPPTY